jgi:hypothetical protein
MRWHITDPLFGFFGRTLLRPVLFLGFLGSTLFGSFQFLGSNQDDLGFMRRNLAERITDEAVGDLPRPQGSPTVAVLNLSGDYQNYITGLLRQKIAASGEYRVLDDSFFVKMMREFGRNQAPISRLADAAAVARQLGVDYVIFGEIPEFKSEAGAGKFKLELRMAERSSGQAVSARSYDREMGGNLILSSEWRARIADSPKGRRIFIWVVFTLLLPVAAIPLIRRIVSAESNLSNLALLLTLTIVDIFVALLLTGFWIPSVWSAIVLLLALGSSGYYNYCIASFVERLSH